MKVSKRGVYYDLSISPYRFETPEGVVLRFSSLKKLEMYKCRVKLFKDEISKLTKKHPALSFFKSSEAWEQFYKKLYEEMIYK